MILDDLKAAVNELTRYAEHPHVYRSPAKYVLLADVLRLLDEHQAREQATASLPSELPPPSSPAPSVAQG